MKISVYSVLMSILCSNIFILILYFLRKKKIIVRYYGIFLVIVLYAFCFVRLLIPVEFELTKVIRAPLIYNQIELFFDTQIIYSKIKIIDMLAAIWGMITMFLIVRHIIVYQSAVRSVSKLPIIEDVNCIKILSIINQRYGKKINVEFHKSYKISVPMGTGVYKKMILLPEREYEDKQLYYIIAHECNHFYNHDVALKLLSKLFCCLFWWNPVVYLLCSELENTLEIKCDITTTDLFAKAERLEYMETITNELKDMCNYRKNNLPKYTVALFGLNRNEIIIERMEAISQKSIKKNGRTAVFTVVGMYTMLFILSYCVIIQPYFANPVEKIKNEEILMDSDEVLVYKTKENKYYFNLKGTDTFIEITKEDADFHIQNGAKFEQEE